MPKMQVYLPDELYAKVKAQQPRLNVSGILQEALEEHLAVLGRRQALDEAIADYEAEFGAFTEEQLDRRVEADLRDMVFPGSTSTKARKRRGPSARVSEPGRPGRLVLDAGAFIALDRNDQAMWERVSVARRSALQMVTHAGIVGQVWRRPSLQARMARAIKYVDVLPLTIDLAQAAGLLLAATGTDDVHDATLALICQPADLLITSDVDDLATLLDVRRVRSVGLLRI